MSSRTKTGFHRTTGKGGPKTALLFLALGAAIFWNHGAHAEEAEPDVSYEEVLKNPDDIRLNVLYAKTQIRNGRLDRAVAALERVLLRAPNLHNVRLLYAIVLFRLDNVEEAKPAFEALKKTEGIEADIVAQADRFLAEIEKKRKRIHHTVSVSAGTHFDTNRNAATTSGTLSVLDTTYDSTEGEKRDTGILAAVTVETRFDPGFQRAHEFYISATGLTDQQTVVNEYDTNSGSVSAGGHFLTDIGDFDVSLSHSQTTLERSLYQRTGGITVSYEKSLNKDVSLKLEETATRQLYYNYGDNTDNDTDSGTLYETTATFRVRLDPTLFFTIAPSYQKKNAKEGRESYRNMGAVTTLTHAFEKGQFISGYLAYNHYSYRAADTFVSSAARREWRYRARLSVGAPLGTLIGDDWIPEELAQTLLTASVERYAADANIVNYTTENWRGQLMLSKIFRF